MIMLQAGYDSTIGIAVRCFKPVSEDGLLVSLLRDAGAIPFVRSNVPALLLLPDTVNAVIGQTINPWTKQLPCQDARIPGGSSGGEAALIAARGSPLGLGTIGTTICGFCLLFAAIRIPNAPACITCFLALLHTREIIACWVWMHAILGACIPL